jgi:hypothetical protein
MLSRRHSGQAVSFVSEHFDFDRSQMGTGKPWKSRKGRMIISIVRWSKEEAAML